ncbi:MAG: oxidoreductase [Ferruginibacter sp.]
MKNKLKLSVIILSLVVGQANAQTLQLLTRGTKTSIRGLSVVDDKTVWVSGSNGTVGLSVDSGNTWKWIQVPNYAKTEFRDIEAFDDKTAIIMGIDSPAYILKTSDGGESWRTVFKDHTKGMFLDAMEFWNDRSGIVIGDPMDGRFFIARTFDGGNSWRGIPEANRPLADSGEACFASSGTNIRKINQEEAVFISGGTSSHLFVKDKKINIPIIQGTESTGANSIAVKDSKTMMIVGGDFKTKDSAFKNCIITNDAGNTWTQPVEAPHGYRSCIEWIEKTNWISCGLNGVDYTMDEGKTFAWISKESYHVCRKAKKGTAVFFAGAGGKIAKLVL